MRITRVKVNGYKNLRDVEFSFENSGGLAVFVGCNGSGKSNFLEALAFIIRDLRGPEILGQGAFDYEIEFQDSDGEKCVAMRRRNDSEPTWTYSEKGKGLTCVPRAVGLYNGEFNRFSSLGLARVVHEGNSAVELVSVADFPVALINYLIEPVTKLDVGDGAVDRKAAKSVTYSIDDGLYIDAESGPEDELEDVLVRLSAQKTNAQGLQEMEFEAFIGVFRTVLGERADDELSTLLSVFFATWGDRIHDFTIHFEKGGCQYSSNDLSEGEKKCVLFDYVLRVGNRDDRIVLLDEPDASVHESRKLELFDCIKEFAKSGGSVFMTTHAPSIINEVDSKSLIGILSAAGSVKLVPEGELTVMSSLTGSRMSFFSRKPIVLFEGKSDVLLLRRATESFRKNEPGYEKLDIDKYFDYFIFGGTGDAPFVYKQFKGAARNRRVFLAFDCDSPGNEARDKLAAGSDGIERLLDITGGVPNQIQSDAVFLIPKPSSLSHEPWMIEDYLSQAYIRSWLANKVSSFSCFHTVVNIQKDLKKSIRDQSTVFTHDNLKGFKPLIDFLVKLQKSLRR